jgi:phosphatidylglycerol:prolipoprotein diacylglycerol transferase
MYALALSMSAATTAATFGLPYFHLGSLDVGVPIQAFGMLVAAGVLIGAALLRRYAEWHGVSDDHIRGLITWILISGFLGAHEFDVIAYQWDRIGDATVVTPAGWWFLPEAMWPSNWPLGLRIWDGISSYGGFIGGALGFALYVWWKRLPVRLFADVTIVGLLPAFSIGRLGCTVVSDHIGAAADPDRWYSFLAMDYPRKVNPAHLAEAYPGTSEFIRAWNLGFVEFLYLAPVTAVILWLAFRPSKRQPAGFVTALAGVLYAPVRFFLDYLRPEDTDPRYLGMTFAQWASILAFVVAVWAARRTLKHGEPAEVVAPTSKEAQQRLRIILKEDVEEHKKQEASTKEADERKKVALATARAERDREDVELKAAERAKAAQARAVETAATGQPSSAAADGDEDEEQSGDFAIDKSEPLPTTAGSKAAASKSGNKPAAKPDNKAGNKAGNKNRNKTRKR